MRPRSFTCLLAVTIGIGCSTALAQQTPIPPANERAASAITDADKLRGNYVLGAGDQVLIRAFEMEEISEKPFRIDGDGDLNLPILGKIKAEGLSVEQLEAELVERLKKYVRQPQVTVTVVQFRSEPVFLVGAFKSPGIYPLQGRRTLVDMISSAGGLLPNASRHVTVTRRKEFGPIPLPNAMNSPNGDVTSVDISMASLRQNINPAQDIELKPFDVITVPRAEMVYVDGAVNKPGGLDVEERDSLSITQAITLSGGLARDSAGQKGMILRPILNTSRRAEIPINIVRVFEGKDRDFPLLPNDVLVVPGTNGSWKRVVGRGFLIAIPIITVVLIRVI